MTVPWPGPELEATAPVHEVYLRLVGERELPWANRAHYYAAAAEAMRRILLDHARGGIVLDGMSPIVYFRIRSSTRFSP